MNTSRSSLRSTIAIDGGKIIFGMNTVIMCSNDTCQLLKRSMKKYCGRFALPGAPKYMSSEEFFDLIDKIGVVSDDFGQREILPIFNCSMMTQIDELDSDRHINMTLVEFIEAIGRLAFKIKLPIPFEYMNLIFKEMVSDNPILADELPLFISIESLIVQMIKC